MKKTLFTLLAMGFMICSCSDEIKETSQIEETVGVIAKTQKVNWIDSKLTETVVNNQKKISHYEFDVKALEELVTTKDVTYVWFDLGLSKENQITFTATGELRATGEIIAQVASKIIKEDTYKADLSIFQSVGNVPLDASKASSHILENTDAYEYITSMKKAYNTFEATLDQDGQRVERFGLDVVVIKRMLATDNIHSLALFLGKNKKQKMTTVFIGKGKKGNLLIDNGTDISTAGRAFDFTDPCPNTCDNCGCPDGSRVWCWEKCPDGSEPKRD
ncbi:hypothetical protein [uncultured Kordia sp.]|uniref:hypothetical protein n=1 Tax=uncultured Kordia sp. TaxID=507699 RepID=UPI002614D88F|nr:hypothetical protein [uncultured Kordia sp.]